ncbi:MAG: CAP domain-containing protein [Pyrinomonadaceae bacterium]
MKIKLLLCLFLILFSQAAFSQNGAGENKPEAYIVSSGNPNSAVRPNEIRGQTYLLSSGRQTSEPAQTQRQAYLVSGGNSDLDLSRPRVAVNFPANPVSKVRTDSSLERQVFALINEKRAALGLAPLVWSDDVARIARLHSENMASFNFFSHTGIDGLMVNDRADECGVSKWRAIGENIAYNKGFANPVAFAVERWMQSPAHRDNLLNSRWKESGIGVAITDDGTYYFTEVFLVRK